MHRTVWQLALAGTLLTLLAMLGTLQYRWVGAVSDAERERLQSSLRSRAHDLAADFNREVTRTYAAFRVDGDAADDDLAARLTEAIARSRAGSSIGGIVKSVLVVDRRGGDAGRLQQLDPVTRRLRPVPWPPALASVQQTIAGRPADRDRMLPPALAGVIDPDVPALLVPLPVMTRLDFGARTAVLPDPDGPARAAIVWLDEAALSGRLLPALVQRYFGSGDRADYYVRVVRRTNPAQAVYVSGGRADVRPENADFAAGLFALNLADLDLFNMHVAHAADELVVGPGTPPETGRVAITIVRKTNGPDGTRVLMAGADPEGGWQLLIRSKRGSLEALVAVSRRRNLGIGLGVLGLLAVSFVFVIGSARRQHTLARQQMEFVAAVSHELRTPLAVIQSAGENLADGVVVERDQVRRYGTLIRTEGYRLADMVERVLEFAGMTSSAPPLATAGVDINQVIDAAVALVAPDAADRGISIVRSGSATLPTVCGDPVALRSAVQNIVGNAVKYSPAGTVVEIESTTGDRGVNIRVADRGLGIDAADLPHIFKPFFRGRRARDAQIRGTGVGLSVVRHVVRAHGGDVRVESVPAAGTTVTVVLPAAAREGAVAAEARVAT